MISLRDAITFARHMLDVRQLAQENARLKVENEKLKAQIEQVKAEADRQHQANQHSQPDREGERLRRLNYDPCEKPPH